jgi:hypothetical protein
MVHEADVIRLNHLSHFPPFCADMLKKNYFRQLTSFFIRDQIFNNENDDKQLEESFSKPNLMQRRMSCDAIRTTSGRDKYF